MFGNQRACAADSSKIDGSVAPNGIHHGVAAVAFADHGGQTQIQQTGRIAVHTPGGCGTAGADGHTGAGWGRSGVINNSVTQVIGQRRAIVQRFANALVCGVAGGIDTATQQNPVACVQFWQIGTNFICGDFVGHTLIHPFFPGWIAGFSFLR